MLLPAVLEKELYVADRLFDSTVRHAQQCTIVRAVLVVTNIVRKKDAALAQGSSRVT